MKVICIKKFLSQGLQYELTYGKAYETHGGLENLLEQSYCLRNDRGFTSYYTKNCFATLDEWRELQLNKIGIE